LKNRPTGKRARAPRKVDFVGAFHKDWERLERSGRYDMYDSKGKSGSIIFVRVGTHRELFQE
jgi:hypothetical protein